MDALTNAAYVALTKNVLPRLQLALARLAKRPSAESAAEPELGSLITEALELLALLAKWSAPGDPAIAALLPLRRLRAMSGEGGKSGDGDEMSDEEALALLAGLEPPKPAKPATTAAKVAAAPTRATPPTKSAAAPAKAPAKPAAKAPAPPPPPAADDETMALLAGAEPRASASDAGVGDELSDEEALALLGSMADASPAAAKPVAATPKAKAKPPATPKASAAPAAKSAQAREADDGTMAMARSLGLSDASDGDDDMTDEQARRLIAEMDAPAATASAARPQAEISDDEARRLLAEMDAPAGAGGDMSDEEARRLLAEMDAPAAPTEAGDDMSDEEARRLLAEMDAPPAPADAGDDMSDEEARRLLAEMDAPAAAPQPAAPRVKATTPPDLSADEEALGMLAAMGGLEDAEATLAAKPAAMSARAPAASAAPARAPAAADDDGHEGGEALAEIDEFSSNDFASDPDMVNDFMTNSDELMETLDATILELEQKPDDKETIEAIFRAAHTLKGAAGMFGFKAIERVMHRMENLFDKVRKGTLRPDSNVIDVVFQGLDVLRALLGAVREGKPSGTKTVPVVRALELAAQGKYVKGSAGDSAGAGGRPGGGEGGGGHGGGDHGGGDGGGGDRKRDSAQSTIRVDLQRLDALVNLVGELVIDRTRFASIEEQIRTTQPQLPVASNMTETVQLFGRHMNEIHEIIMKIRMVPSRETSAPYALWA